MSCRGAWARLLQPWRAWRAAGRRGLSPTRADILLGSGTIRPPPSGRLVHPVPSPRWMRLSNRAKPSLTRLGWESFATTHPDQNGALDAALLRGVVWMRTPAQAGSPASSLQVSPVSRTSRWTSRP